MTAAETAQAEHDFHRAVDRLRIVRVQRKYGLATANDEKYAKADVEAARARVESVGGEVG